MPTAYLNETQVAERLGLTKRTLQNWRVRGEGPPFRSFNRKAIRYGLEDLEAWEAAALRTSTSGEVTARNRQRRATV